VHATYPPLLSASACTGAFVVNSSLAVESEQRCSFKFKVCARRRLLALLSLSRRRTTQGERCCWQCLHFPWPCSWSCFAHTHTQEAVLKRGDKSDIKLPPFGQGWFDSVYSDPRIRIARDVRGDVLVAARDGPPREFWARQAAACGAVAAGLRGV